MHNSAGIGFKSNARSIATLKMEKLKKFAIEKNVDLVCLTEINKDWRKLEYDNSIWGATSHWKENRRVQVSQNTSKPPQKSETLFGGTAMIAFDNLVFPISAQGQDTRNLGRWGHITLTGKNGLNTTIFTCYCPTRNTSPGSVFSQHLTYMAENKDHLPTNTCPRQLFGMDLKNVISEYIDLGHQIIVMGDFNSEYAKLKHWMLQLGLQDIIAEQHGPGPKTYERSKNSPIDCIFGTPQIRMTSGGFLSFGKLMGDHRGIWIDVPSHIIYGYNPPHPTLFQARRLKVLDPRVVKKYQDHLHASMQSKDLFYRMESLHKRTVFPLPEHLCHEYEEIDRIVTALMDNAEKQCRKLHTGSIPWSPIYKNSCQLVLYWLMRKSYHLKKLRNVRKIIVLQKKLNIIYNKDLTLQEIETEIRLAFKLLKQCKANAESLSLEYRTQLAIAKEEAGEGKAVTFLKNMNRHENQRRLYRNIRHMEKKIRAGATRKITCTVNDTTTEHTDKDIIESLIIDENDKKYHQTEGGSQFLEPEFLASLGNYGEGPDINKVLNGTYTCPQSASIDTADFIHTCLQTEKAKHSSEHHPNVVSRYKTISSSWNIRKEKTCTYHQHIGHYKSIFKDKRLSWFFFQRMEIPQLSGYSPIRHRECIDLMIMKKQMCYDINKQRTIGILDTEFNQANKLVGQDAMNLAIDNGYIAEEQFAKKHTSSIDQTIAKRCFIDHNRSQRICFSIGSSDLAGCFDRIVHTAVALALLRVGIPHSKIHSMFNTIQRMVHYIRTAFGDSTISYGGDSIGNWENYPQGVLQGNAAGPTIWTILSSVVFEILHQRGFSVKFCSALSKQVFFLIGFSYVDDCDLIQSGSSPIAVLQSMQQLIHTWGSTMEVTGGAINIEKSWWYLIDFVWFKGKWVTQDAELGTDLVATSTNGQLISLKRLHSYEASEMLGVWISPDGNNSKLIEELQTTASNWSAKVLSGNPSQKEAWLALHTTITAKLKYPLPACTLSAAECRSIMTPVIKAALPRAGLSSKLPTSIRDCPSSCGGAGVLNLFDYQGTARTAMLVEQIHRKTTTGKLLLQNVEDLVLESGLYGSLWLMPFEDISKYIADHSLVYHILSYNYSNDIKINTDHECLIPKRMGDRTIMQLALSSFSTSKELKAIQRVRMSLGITCLSDICSIGGDCLDSYFYDKEPKKRCRNSYIWPSKHHTYKSDYTLWRKFLKMIFSEGTHALFQPLGNWTTTSQLKWIDHWDYFVTPDQQFLYHQEHESSWKRHLYKPSSHHSYYLEFLQCSAPPDSILLRATVQFYQNKIQVLKSCEAPPTTVPIPNFPSHRTFDSISTGKPKINWFMDNLSSSPSTLNLLHHLLSGTALAVSDGSFFPDTYTGAAAWIVASPDGKEWIQGGGLIPGDPEDQDPYRSELGGQLGLAAFCSSIILPAQDPILLTVACDGESALKQVSIGRTNLKCNKKHIDLISIINDLWESAPFKIKKQHVYGHQDQVGRQLTTLESLNCRVDLLAKDIALHHIHLQAPPLIPAQTSLGFGTISCSTHIITGKIQSSLYRILWCTKLLSWLNTKHPGSINITYSDIHWKSYKKARKEARFGVNRFITKWLGQSVSTGKKLLQRQHRVNPSCPICHNIDEDQLHVLTCPSSSSHRFRLSLLDDLASWLKSTHTHPDITYFFIHGFKIWFQHPTHQFSLDTSIFTSDNNINSQLLSQLNLGWYNTLCGFLSPSLISLQQDYYTEISSQRSSLRWATNMTSKLWQVTYQIWCQRNDVLHSNNNIHLLSGLKDLKEGITFEYHLNLESLHPVYSSYFHLPLTTLLTKSSTYLKNWFLIIRTARESYGAMDYDDDFSSNGPLRTWIGLSRLS